MERDPAEYAYLDMIQGVVNRLASTSAAFKGFAITLAAGILAIATSAAVNRALLFAIALIGVIAIACFDCWYFLMEKRYRRLFDAVRDGEHPIDFDMSHQMKEEVRVSDAARSKSIWLFYVVVIAVLVAMMAICQTGAV